MIQEYLIQETSDQDAIKKITRSGITKRVFAVDEGKCLYIQFSVNGDSIKQAKQLSSLDEYIRSHFNVTVLEDGCSAYFNRRLYPLVSEFEYKLRKLLYLTSALNHDEKSASNIADLESQDFGQIFTLLFIDTAFMGKVKEEVKARNRDVFSKADVIAAIESIEESTLWDKLLGKDSVPSLRKRFNDVRMYRNDVMHSHHLHWKKFRDILSIYKTINRELDNAIHDIEIVESKIPSRPSFNKTLDDALREQELFSQVLKSYTHNPAIAEAIKGIVPNYAVSPKELELFSQISKSYTPNPAIAETIKGINEIVPSYTVSPELQKTVEQFSKLSTIYTPDPALSELQEQFKNITKLKIDIPSEIQLYPQSKTIGSEKKEEQTDISSDDYVVGGNH